MVEGHFRWDYRISVKSKYTTSNRNRRYSVSLSISPENLVLTKNICRMGTLANLPLICNLFRECIFCFGL